MANPTITGLIETGKEAGFGSKPLSSVDLTAIIINSVLGLSGIIFLVMIVWGGIQYFISQGDPDRIKSAKGTLTWSVVGLVVVVSAYAIVTFFFTTLGQALGS